MTRRAYLKDVPDLVLNYLDEYDPEFNERLEKWLQEEC